MPPHDYATLLLPAWVRSPWLVFVGYFDESGTDPKQNVITVAGFVAKAKHWASFSKKWHQILKKRRVSAFHAADLEFPCHGEYEGWTRVKTIKLRQELLQRLEPVIAYGVAAAVDKRIYAELVVNEADLPKKVGTPYSLCAAGCVSKVIVWAKRRGITEPIAFVFESRGGQGELADWFDRVRPKENLLGPITFGDKTVLPLHAADFHAYESYKYFTNNVADGQLRPVRHSLKELLGLRNTTAEITGNWWDREALQNQIEHVRHATDY
jgi:hypothetical protein